MGLAEEEEEEDEEEMEGMEEVGVVRELEKEVSRRIISDGRGFRLGVVEERETEEEDEKEVSISTALLFLGVVEEREEREGRGAVAGFTRICEASFLGVMEVEEEEEEEGVMAEGLRIPVFSVAAGFVVLLTLLLIDTFFGSCNEVLSGSTLCLGFLEGNWKEESKSTEDLDLVIAFLGNSDLPFSEVGLGMEEDVDLRVRENEVSKIDSRLGSEGTAALVEGREGT